MSDSTKIHGRTFVIGDIHGQFQKLTGLLLAAGLISGNLEWTGGSSSLWFLGDFFDRGVDGLKSLELVMRLQGQAAAVGGTVDSLIGNHEVLLMAVQRFEFRKPSKGVDFVAEWKRNGGRQEDLDGITLQHLNWLRKRPALKLLNSLLLIHADSPFYSELGWSVLEVNRTFAKLLENDNPQNWEHLLDLFSDHFAFSERRAGGPAAARRFLDAFGASRLIHGHSPIHAMCGITPQQVTGPHFYADRLCVNVDGGMYAGGPGFLFEVPGDWI